VLNNVRDAMSATWDTTEREESPERGTGPVRYWLRWVYPSANPAIELRHGVIVGRGEECAIRIEGKRVSRRHLEIYRQGPIFALRDLGSTNGFFLNGKRAEHVAITPGSVLRVGENVGVFSASIHSPRSFGEIAPALLGGDELATEFAPIARAASSDISIILVGATGTGKERVARAIHELSRRKGEFQALNCAALPKDLAEAELFGYRKGAFTGAERASLGRFRAAEHGTLFLDEVAELSLEVQAKLLRIVEERAVTPLGETESLKFDVRVVAAAQWPLAELVAQKCFRADLAARLSGLTVSLPPLRERRADIASLFLHFVRHYSGGRPPEIDAKLIENLCLHDWPGNVRELEQLARRLLVVHGLEARLTHTLLPAEWRLPTEPTDSLPPSASEPVERKDYDRRRLAAALRQSGGNVSAAAGALGFSRQRAYRLLNGEEIVEFVARTLDSRSGSEGEST